MPGMQHRSQLAVSRSAHQGAADDRSAGSALAGITRAKLPRALTDAGAALAYLSDYLGDTRLAKAGNAFYQFGVVRQAWIIVDVLFDAFALA
jgi:hypothetical protein